MEGGREAVVVEHGREAGELAPATCMARAMVSGGGQGMVVSGGPGMMVSGGQGMVVSVAQGEWSGGQG